MYDIIGDIHGHADKLIRLLSKLSYIETNGVWSHPTRTLISIGDLVDRGPKQREVVDILKAMHRAGHAQVIMGNHEFNAVSWYYKDKQGKPLRAHTDKNRGQHQAFLTEAEADASWYADTISWFASLPLLIETNSYCCVHAAWQDEQIAYLKSVLDDNFSLNAEDWVHANTKGHPLYDAIEYCLKGPELDLPAGASFVDTNGNVRQKIRLKWWDLDATSTYASAAVSVSDDATLPTAHIPHSCLEALPSNKPIFFGHYWMTGKPEVLSSYIACLDWSVVKENGCLAAYQYDGEETLSDDKWVAV